MFEPVQTDFVVVERSSKYVVLVLVRGALPIGPLSDGHYFVERELDLRLELFGHDVEMPACRFALRGNLRGVPFLGALLVISVAAIVGAMPSPDFPFDPRFESLGTGGTISGTAASPDDNGLVQCSWFITE